MTTREAAIYEFFSSFGIPAYASSATPAQAVMPYITYDLVIGDFYYEVAMNANVWYKTDSEAEPNKKIREIESELKGGKLLTYDGGAVWVKKGSPWCTSVKDEDNTVKRRYLNFDLEYIEI